jgi:hypothetical protein
MKFLSVIVVASIILCIICGIVAVVFQAVSGEELSPTLVDNWYTVFGIELGATALIQITKTITDEIKRRNKIKHMTENGIEPKHSDFSGTQNEYYDGFYSDPDYDEPMG